MRGIAQKQPINEYEQEAFGLFESMLDTLREEVTRILFRAELRVEPPQMQSLPDLPDFLTGHVDSFTGMDNSGDGDGSELRPELFGSLAGSPRAATGPGGANTKIPSPILTSTAIHRARAGPATSTNIAMARSALRRPRERRAVRG